ncbi:MAG: aminotransferase class III-fold pyridoxal phosphate-dependent enzyme [Calditrichaeota bacterium]|nr:aminotransferase class III-fold pyridoxal phosphate-dependent enzyme [Calditrichota bacterium]
MTHHDEILRENLEYSLFSWSAQGSLNPISMTRSQGVYFWDANDKRWLDFSSQLMYANLGHSHPRMVRAIQEQAGKLCFAYPGIATEVRGKLAHALADVTPAGLKKSFFTLGGADAIENAIKMARLVTGRSKILGRNRAYHGGSYASAAAGGDPRRHLNGPEMPGFIHIPDPYSYRSPLYRHCSPEEGDMVLADLIEDTILIESPDTVAALLLEGWSGTSGIITPQGPAFWQRMREICDRYGILLIDDEVMSGFGRTGKMFAIEHHGVTPDMMCLAKGLTGGYLPMGAVMVSEAVGKHFDDHFLNCGLTYNAHPMACAAALEAISIYRDEQLVQNAARLGEHVSQRFAAMQDAHPSLGEYRGTGLFWCLEIVKNRDTRAAMSPWNQPMSKPMTEAAALLRSRGLSTFVRWNYIFVVPPLVINQSELDEGLGIIEESLALLDGHCD